MAPTSFKRIILAERPTGDIVPDVTFKQLDAPFDESMRPGAHAALVKVQHISIGASSHTDRAEQRVLTASAQHRPGYACMVERQAVLHRASQAGRCHARGRSGDCSRRWTFQQVPRR
jgi:hypothetical protein